MKLKSAISCLIFLATLELRDIYSFKSLEFSTLGASETKSLVMVVKFMLNRMLPINVQSYNKEVRS